MKGEPGALHLRREFTGTFFPFWVPTASLPPGGAIAITLSFANSHLIQILETQSIYCDGQIAAR